MKTLLILSAILICASFYLVYHNQEAHAVPYAYNITSLSVPFTSFSRNLTSAAQELFIESGFNGTVTAHYTASSDTSKIVYDFGNHPTLPLTFDTFGNLTASAVTTATQKLNVTVASGHNNRVLVAMIVFQHNGDANHNNARMSSLKIGSLSPFTLIKNQTVTCGANACSAETWYFIDPPTGFNTITITPASVTTYHMVAGVYSLYNVRHLAVFGDNQTGTGTSVTPTSTIRPTYTGTSILLQNIFSQQTVSPTGQTDTLKWVGKTSALMGASQMKLNPTINAINTMTVTTTNVQWATNAIEIVPIQDQTTFNFYTSLAPPILGTPYQKYAVNGSNVYFFNRIVASGNYMVNHLNVDTGIETHDYTAATVGGTRNSELLFVNTNGVKFIGNAGVSGVVASAVNANGSVGPSTYSLISNQDYLDSSGRKYWYNTNGSGSDTRLPVNQQAYVTFVPTNKTTPINAIVGDMSIPAHVNKFWSGINVVGSGNYYGNSTLNLLTTISASTYKVPLTIPAVVYGITDNETRLLGHWGGVDYLVSVNPTTIKYTPMAMITGLLTQNRATQAFMTTDVNVDSQYHLEPSTINPNVPINFIGPSLNTTTSKYGMISLPSGYYMRTTNFAGTVRTVDPQWTNTPSQNLPVLTTSGAMFPIVLTVSNAPTDGGLMATDGAQVINGNAGIWTLTKLDSTHTAEFDITPGQCANIYVGDISVKPVVYNYEGFVCATGTSQKTLAYTNTLPLTFYTLRYGSTYSYTPTTNALSVTTRSSTSPFTYNILIKNSTGAIAQNFTTTINGTIDTHNFNVSGVTKPAQLFVSIPSIGQIYSAYIGSPLSFASTVSFFHQYLSYQGFDLLSFIPLIFASMFTRNTVGIGTALVVVLIATLSFLSVVVVSDTVVIVSMVVAVIGLIGYRGLYG